MTRILSARSLDCPRKLGSRQRDGTPSTRRRCRFVVRTRPLLDCRPMTAAVSSNLVVEKSPSLRASPIGVLVTSLLPHPALPLPLPHAPLRRDLPRRSAFVAVVRATRSPLDAVPILIREVEAGGRTTAHSARSPSARKPNSHSLSPQPLFSAPPLRNRDNRARRSHPSRYLDAALRRPARP